MKRTLFFVCMLMICSGLSFSQSQRLVLAEEFTNACCSPCASQNPAFDALLSANPLKITSIKYHVNWPGADPMNAHDASDASSRVSYYAVTGVPDCQLDGPPTTGSNYSGAPANLSQANINTEYAVTSPFEMHMQQLFSTNQDSVYITILIHCTQAVSGLLVLQTAEIEKHIHYTSAPGTNGETDFYNVMVKMFPAAGGLSLPGSWSVGDYSIVQFAWKLPTTIYDKTQLACVAFIQNNTTKSVLQACNSTNAAIAPIYNNDASVTGISNIPVSTCTSSITPTVTIRNNGNQALTSCTINYHVNNESVQTFQWNGNLAPWQKAVVNLPVVTYSLNNNNYLYVITHSPNGVTDEYYKNDSMAFKFTKALVAVNKVHLDLRTDNAPQETTWTIKNSGGGVIASGGPYTQASTVFSIDVAIPSVGCYLFTVNDAGNNGLENGNGHGYYSLSDSIGTTICEGAVFGSKEAQSFEVLSVGINEISCIKNLKAYPNPFESQFYLNFSLKQETPVNVEVFNNLGENVYTRIFDNLVAGENKLRVGGDQLAPGVYYIRLTIGKEVRNLKITK